MRDDITIRGAREHNLDNIDVVIPRNRLVVITGVSGSGKSSLAFDTLFAEGQRRYVESLSAYARQFLDQMEKPDVDTIDGLSPAISIEQKTTSRNPRSTVGTVTEIHDYLRLMWASVGVAHCPDCDIPIRPQTVEQMVDRLLGLDRGTRFMLLAPVVESRKGEHRKLFEQMVKEGFVRARVDGRMVEAADPPQLDKKRNHTVEVVVDRLSVRDGVQARLADCLETALRVGEGLARAVVAGGEEIVLSSRHACPGCGFSLSEISPRLFSLQLAPGGVPGVLGPRLPARGRPGEAGARPRTIAGGRLPGDRGARSLVLGGSADPTTGRPHRLRPPHPMAAAARGGAAVGHVRLRR